MTTEETIKVIGHLRTMESKLMDHRWLSDEESQAVEIAIEALKKALTQQWISCEERLPKPNETKELVRKYYLTQNEWGDMMVACYEGDATKNWWEQMYQYKETEDKIVAWRPLPEPWRGESDERKNY